MPKCDGFASGTIDLGGLQVSQVTTFNKIWRANEGGPDNLGATFYDPIAIPQGFSSLGSYAQPNNVPLSGHILVVKDTSNDPSNPTLKPPIDYTLLWSSESLDTKKMEKDTFGFQLHPKDIRPSVGNQRVANLKGNLSNSMPNLNQIKALIQTYSPVIYFHPDEQYLPSSVDWFFQNGALLYHKGDESKPTRVDNNGLNLPQGGSNDDTYWLDLPLDGSSKDRVKKGNLQDACAYFHIKPVSEGLFTDIAIWVFYPFNGASRAKVKFLNLSLGKLGEHVGDWEHVTLRISNINGELNSVFFSQHSWGKWVSASELEYHNGNKPVVYASLHGHASYPKPGCVLLGSGGADIGVRDDTAKSDKMMDTGARAVVMAAEYLPAATVVEPPWLNYERKWGPKIDYDVDKEISKLKSVMIWKLKKEFGRLMEGVPRELLGEDGPTGPKVKTSWSGDETV
ncbi:hypothetical protein E3N88_02166 [Mikania micrantha]|uniref:Vacuolar protein sorting-associated protein 62 n=1 Tax=Mikania micrantha TaxID=192012 RepID=A0A5N6Q5Q4_9ASTR|nr:hypothetical protein E3N88_02166 [Mikania micrantha]